MVINLAEKSDLPKSFYNFNFFGNSFWINNYFVVGFFFHMLFNCLILNVGFYKMSLINEACKGTVLKTGVWFVIYWYRTGIEILLKNFFDLI